MKVLGFEFRVDRERARARVRCRAHAQAQPETRNSKAGGQPCGGHAHDSSINRADDGAGEVKKAKKEELGDAANPLEVDLISKHL